MDGVYNSWSSPHLISQNFTCRFILENNACTLPPLNLNVCCCTTGIDYYYVVWVARKVCVAGSSTWAALNPVTDARADATDSLTGLFPIQEQSKLRARWRSIFGGLPMTVYHRVSNCAEGTFLLRLAVSIADGRNRLSMHSCFVSSPAKCGRKSSWRLIFICAGSSSQAQRRGCMNSCYVLQKMKGWS
jgi:hypothetical protein